MFNFSFLCPDFLIAAQCKQCMNEECSNCQQNTKQCPDTTFLTPNPSTSVCDCPSTTVLGKQSTTNYYYIICVQPDKDKRLQNIANQTPNHEYNYVMSGNSC